MAGDSVRRVYGTLQAVWYDPLKRLWNGMAASRAEEDLSLFLRENLDESKTILELGCGTAQNLEKIFSLTLGFRSYLGLDFSPDMLRIARRKFHGCPHVEFRERDVTEPGDTGSKFDVLLCTWVLSHLLSPSTFVNRAQELMKEGGKFFLIFFTEPRWYLRLWMAPLARLLLRSQYVRDEEVDRFKKVKRKSRYSGNMVMVIEIY